MGRVGEAVTWAVLTYLVAGVGVMAMASVGYGVGAIAVAMGLSRGWIPDDVERYAWWAFNIVGWPFYAITTTVWALGWVVVLARRWSGGHAQPA